MNVKKTSLAVLLLAAATAATLYQPFVFAQSAGGTAAPKARQNGFGSTLSYGQGSGGLSGATFFDGRGFYSSSTSSEIGKLVRELGDTDDAAKKDELKKKLSDLLDKAFEEDAKSREKELENLEARIKKLKGQLERRRKSKSEIVDLQLKVLVNESEGLGFSPTGSSLRRGGGGVGLPASALDVSDFLDPVPSVGRPVTNTK